MHHWYVGVLIELGLGAAFFAMLPILLGGLGVGSRLTWLLMNLGYMFLKFLQATLRGS